MPALPTFKCPVVAVQPQMDPDAVVVTLPLYARSIISTAREVGAGRSCPGSDADVIVAQQEHLGVGFGRVAAHEIADGLNRVGVQPRGRGQQHWPHLRHQGFR